MVYALPAQPDGWAAHDLQGDHAAQQPHMWSGKQTSRLTGALSAHEVVVGKMLCTGGVTLDEAGRRMDAMKTHPYQSRLWPPILTLAHFRRCMRVHCGLPRVLSALPASGRHCLLPHTSG